MTARSTRLADLVAVSEAVAATRSRTAKTAAIAAHLANIPLGDIEIATSYLSGAPRQDAIGVGWSGVAATDVAPTQAPSLTLLDVDSMLQQMTDAGGPGSQLRQTELLKELFARATEPEQSFLGRLMLRHLRQGATAGIMIEAIAEAFDCPAGAVRRATMLTADLSAIARLAKEEGVEGVAGVQMEVMRPIQPMLATGGAEIAEIFHDGKPRFVDRKFDGARIQVHRSGNDVRIYTRNLIDATDRLAGLTADVLQLPYKSIVLDGEALVVRSDGTPVLFQDTMQHFSSDGTPDSLPTTDDSSRLVAQYFDVLSLDDHNLLDTPLNERRKVLEQLPAHLVVPGITTGNAGVAGAFLEDSVAQGHEGIMIKDLDSPYVAGRRGKTWRKIKPVYTIDLVVLAVEWGSGRRQGWLSNIHLGARTSDGYAMVGKTFKGMTDEMLAWQTERFLALETSRSGHVVHVRPEQVVEIAIDGVQRSSTYDDGVALRFARVKRYRTDKTAAEADTLTNLREMFTAR